MTEERVRRRLAAILAADVAGYSRLMGADEAGTLARIRDLRVVLLDPKVAEYGGRIVKTMGDGLLIEFPSAVDAVAHALDVQEAMAGRDADLPEDRRIALRIGINVGDVIVEGDDLYGDGVNVAARLEAAAEPGGICVSADVQRQAEGKLAAAFRDLGERALKNIDRPVRLYAVEPAAPDGAEGGVAEPALALPDKPSIAVLPFQNMSGDPEQEYFADGIAEDIITALSRFHWFFVIARNSTFTYKGRAVDVKAVARELGVRYVLEGSVRRSTNRVRVTAQLIDGAAGSHVWAERYDRELEDIFAVQDEITETIVGAIETEMGRSERERAKVKRPESLHAWDLFQRGMWHTYRRTRDDLAEARALFGRAIEAAPSLAQAYAGAEEACFFQVVGGYTDAPDATKEEALRLGRHAVELDSQDAFARYALGRALTCVREHGRAIPELETAVALNRNFAQAYYALGMALGTSGRPAEAIPHIETAMRLSPHDPYLGQFMVRMGEAHLFLRRHAEAVEWARRSLSQPNIQWSRWACLAAALAHAGAEEEARQAVVALRRMKPETGIAFVGEYWPIADPDSLAYLLDGLRKAGLPE